MVYAGNIKIDINIEGLNRELWLKWFHCVKSAYKIEVTMTNLS